jgi:sulfite reductase (ferredoxin)
MGNEEIKAESRFLRGTIAESLETETTHFDEADLQLLKFHGSYQQDDRDERRARRAAGRERAYQFMTRSRIPGGELTAQQYLVHDDLACRYGNGTVRFTTRQGIQLHGVLKGDLRPAIRSINESLLSTLAACGDVNRNVMACPAPLASRARSIVNDLAHQLALHLAPQSRAYHEIWLDGEKAHVVRDEADREPLYGKTYLPRKFKIGLTVEGDNCVDIYTQDIGFVAHPSADGDLTGFTVLVGGGLGSTHGKSETYPRLGTPLCHIAPDELLYVAEKIVTIQRDHGDRTNRKHARMKYLVQERGVGWFRAQLEERLNRSLAPPRDLAFAPLDDHLGWHPQANGRWFFGLHVTSGRVYDGAEGLLLSALRDIARRFAPNLRITGQQNVLLTDISAEVRDELEALMLHYGVTSDPVRLGLARHAMACPALPTCGLAVAEGERALPAILEELQRALAYLGLPSEWLSVRMTGCPNGCARPRMGDVGIVGRSPGIYDLFVGGDLANTRLNSLYAKGVRVEDVVATLRPLLEVWRDERHDGEPLGDFWHRRKDR